MDIIKYICITIFAVLVVIALFSQYFMHRKNKHLFGLLIFDIGNILVMFFIMLYSIRGKVILNNYTTIVDKRFDWFSLTVLFWYAVVIMIISAKEICDLLKKQ